MDLKPDEIPAPDELPETLRPEPALAEDFEPEDGTRATERPPALTIQVQSWATPVAAVVMLAVGLLAGYYLRPILDPPAAPAPVPVEGASTEAGEQVSAEQLARQEALMDAILPRVRHFKGDEGAPVSLIEFSDFQ